MSCQDVNQCFQPLLFSQHFFYEGIKRCNENLKAKEKCEFCGPIGAPCADCYICCSIVCIGCDIITCPWRYTYYTKEKYYLKKNLNKFNIVIENSI